MPCTRIVIAKLTSTHPENGTADADLPGFQSHVRYSIFKERRCFARLSRGEKRTGNLAFMMREVNCVLAEGSFLQPGQYRWGPPDCQGHPPQRR